MEKKPKMKNLIRLNPFSLDKIKKIKKNPIIIKKKNIELNKLSKNNQRNNQAEKTFLNNTLNNFRKSNSFITKDNINKKELYLSNNKIYDNLKDSMEKDLKFINSNQHINNINKMLEIFQNELIYQLGEKYNHNEINNIFQKNFGNIIKYLSNSFKQYEKKCSNFKSNLNKIINNLKIKEKDNSTDKKKLNYSKNSRQIINNYTHNNNNIIIFDENKKKHFLNEEENIVNLINNLSSNIRICNKKNKISLINIANLIDFSNNKLIEIKKKLESINDNIFSKYNIDFKYLNEIKEINNLYLVNINIITEIKLLDDNQKIFFDEAKEIFNNLKINHKIKIKEYQKLFESIQNIQSKSKSKEKPLNCYYTFNNLYKNKKFYDYNKEKREKSLPNEIKTNKNELKYLKLNINNNRTRNLDNILNETNSLYNNRNYSYNLTNSFNNSNANSFNTTNNIFSIKLKEEDNNKFNNCLINNNKFKIENSNRLYYLAEKIMIFFNKMNNLQLSIINKKPNVNQQKRDFEVFKKRLIECTKNIIEKKANKSSNDIYEDNKFSQNKNNLFKFDINKLQLIFNDKFNIKSTKDNKQNKNENKEKEILNLVDKNKELTEEIKKIKEKNNNLIIDKNENNKLKNVVVHILDLIKTKIKESENLNIHQKELKEILDLFYKKKENENNDDYLDIELINKIINNYEIYFNELIYNFEILKKEKEKLMKESQDNLLEAEKYKESLDKALSNKNNEKEKIDDKINIIEDEKNNNVKSKISLIIDQDGELSFKGESFKLKSNININEDESNKFISPLLDNNTTGSFPNNNNYNINRLNNNNISKSSNDIKIINSNKNESYEENKIFLKDKNNGIINEDNNENNNDNLNINKELLKYQNNLKNKIKALEEEVETLKNKNLNFFLEIKNELCDFNEEKISLSKYINLIKLYEKEQETNKKLEKNYISSIEKINNNLLNYFKKMNCEFEIDSNEKNIITNSQENKKTDNIKNDLNKYVLNKTNNLHFDYSNLFKAKSILKMNENNEDKNEKIENNIKDLKIKNIIEENNSLKKNEKLLLEQLNIIKAEIKELNLKIEKKEEKIKRLNQDLERQILLQKDKLYIPLRNGLEKLITEINLTDKIKDLLRDLLNISLYNNEEIEKIFKYKEKKKNIIGIIKF